MLRNTAKYMLGTVLAQLVMLGAMPLLSRLYTPEDFGDFGLFSALLGIIGVAACLRYEVAIPLPRTDRGAACLFATGLLSLIFTSLFTLIGVVLFGQQLANWLGGESLSTLLWWLPLSVFGYGLYELMNYWSTRSDRFSSLAISRVFRSGAVAGTQIAASQSVGSSLGLVLGQLVGQWIANLFLLSQTLRKDLRLLRTGFALKKILANARLYKTFPLHGAPQAVINSASQSMPIIILAWFFSPGVVGMYVMAQRAVSAPLSLIAQSLRQAMLPHFSRHHNQGLSLTTPLLKYSAFLALLGFPVLMILFFWGEELFSFVFGGRWREAGYYAEWLVLWLWAGMINPPAVVTLTVLKKQKLQAKYELFLLFSRVLSLLSAALTGSVVITLIAFSLTGFLFNLALIGVAYIESRKTGALN